MAIRRFCFSEAQRFHLVRNVWQRSEAPFGQQLNSTRHFMRELNRLSLRRQVGLSRQLGGLQAQREVRQNDFLSPFTISGYREGSGS
jgi:hypothetical protein